MRFLPVVICLFSACAASAAEPADTVRKFLTDRMPEAFEIERLWPAEPSQGAKFYDGEDWDTIQNEGQLVRVRIKTKPEPAGKLRTEKNAPKPERYDFTCLVENGEVIMFIDSPLLKLPNEQDSAWKRRTGGRIAAGFTSASRIVWHPTAADLTIYIDYLREHEPWLSASERHEKAIRMYKGSRTYAGWLKDVADGKYLRENNR